MKFKVMNYNIKEGLAYIKGEDYIRDSAREKLIKKVVKEENPDILILTEACWLKNNSLGFRRNYKKIFGYKYYAYGSDYTPEIDWGVAILSKYPIREWYDYCLMGFRWVRAFIKIGNEKIMLDAVHPTPSVPENKKKQWFKTVIRDMEKPYLIAGDFNVLSPRDSYDENKLIREFRKYTTYNDKSPLKKAREITKDDLKKETISFLLKNKLVDTYYKKNKNKEITSPTSNYPKMPNLRLDYIFCSNDISVLDSGIIKNETTEKASDHYPVYSILELNKGS